MARRRPPSLPRDEVREMVEALRWCEGRGMEGLARFYREHLGLMEREGRLGYGRTDADRAGPNA